LAQAGKLSTLHQWWNQFPAPLRELASVRLVASFGAGGVLYLTPMVFHQADFSASQVGTGLALTREQRKALSNRLLAPGVDIGPITDIDGDSHGGSGSILNHFRLLRAESRPVSRTVRVVVSGKLGHKKEKLRVAPAVAPTLDQGREE
jgi:hypothetical protein